MSQSINDKALLAAKDAVAKLPPLSASRRALAEVAVKAYAQALPQPEVAPLGIRVTREMVQDVWDAWVKPDQEKDLPQSAEMRSLMAILRWAFAALPGDSKEDGQ